MSRNFESSTDIRTELNPEQHAAATYEGRTLLVLAGAGKTSTIIARLHSRLNSFKCKFAFCIFW